MRGLLRLADHGQKAFAETTSSRPEQKEVVIVLVRCQVMGLNLNLSPEKRFILSDILHLNSLKGKENSILNRSVRNLHPYSVMTPWESARILTSWMLGLSYHFVSLRRPAKIYWRRVVHISHPQKELWLGLASVSSLHISVVNLNPRCGTGIKTELRLSLCARTGLLI